MSENEFEFNNFIRLINRQADRDALEANLFLIGSMLFGPVLIITSILLG